MLGFVSPPHRRRGLGAELYDAAHAHLVGVGARSLESWTTDDPGARFLVARGFRPVARSEILQLDLAAADLSGLDGLRAAKAGGGLRGSCRSRRVADRAEELYALDAGATADVPATFTRGRRPARGLASRRRSGTRSSRPTGSFVVLTGGEPVAYAFLHVDPGLARRRRTR